MVASVGLIAGSDEMVGLGSSKHSSPLADGFIYARFMRVASLYRTGRRATRSALVATLTGRGVKV